MKHFKLALVFLVSISIFISCSSNNSADDEQDVLDPLESYTELNVSYGSDSDQVFDLYLPANRTTATKTIILVHGGGWSSGDKEDMNDFKDYILEQMPSYAVVNINYRLADANNDAYPMQINDITSVVDYLENNEDYYTISNAIGFVGVSAGAHLSLLWSYGFDTNSQTEMVCSVVGPTNFTDPAYLENTDPILQLLLMNLGIDTSTSYLEEISPYHRVTASAPPTIMFYGGNDPLIPTTQGTALRDKLEELNVTHEFTLYPEEGHGWVGLNLIDTTTKLQNFIQTYL
ncbi:alpha/beta hydrolase [Winogradskyella endarachnes]|uniref:Alpha/beta hydrolase fold domain-containing protein n=1 Tax=Winogradskyella endarachnes TaxID=2681965 RepID=A0A6L6U7X2_9FLAO|nr:alpha/beta hydrolase [Winogradskyella endarachnes]MUU78431.1 alpha/beta hydrolase fold domain-containing protein [Winogradskyella endarachnes]